MLTFSSVIFVCSSGYAGITGKYETYNIQNVTNSDATQSMSRNFFGLFNRDVRAPAHDTPASVCNCSKFLFFFLVICCCHDLKRF